MLSDLKLYCGMENTEDNKMVHLYLTDVDLTKARKPKARLFLIISKDQN